MVICHHLNFELNNSLYQVLKSQGLNTFRLISFLTRVIQIFGNPERRRT